MKISQTAKEYDEEGLWFCRSIKVQLMGSLFAYYSNDNGDENHATGEGQEADDQS